MKVGVTMITSKNILLNLESDKLSIEQKEALSRKKEKAFSLLCK